MARPGASTGRGKGRMVADRRQAEARTNKPSRSAGRLEGNRGCLRKGSGSMSASPPTCCQRIGDTVPASMKGSTGATPAVSCQIVPSRLVANARRPNPTPTAIVGAGLARDASAWRSRAQTKKGTAPRPSQTEPSASCYWIGRICAVGAAAMSPSVGATVPPLVMFSHTVPTAVTANARLPVTPACAATAVP